MNLLFILYNGAWYRTTSSLNLSSLTIANFDMVVSIAGNDLHVLKDRYGGTTGGHGNADLLKMKLFISGKSLNDFPVFIPCMYQHVNTNFKIEPNGNLIEYHIEN